MRLLPKTLKGQLIAVSLVALFLSQVASLLVILNDRQAVISAEWFNNVLSRIATVKEVIETTSSENHDKILKSLNGGSLRFVIQNKAAVSPGGLHDDTIKEELARVFGAAADSVGLKINEEVQAESRLQLFVEDLWRDFVRTFSLQHVFELKPPQRRIYARVSVPLSSGNWLNVTIMTRSFAPLLLPLLAQVATMIVLSALGIIFVIGRVTRPLKTLAEAATALGSGQKSQRISESGTKELAETIHAFNEMQDRLGRFVHERTKMLAALSHDLRTPITSLRLRAEFIEEEETRTKVIETLDEMLKMTEATLAFAGEEAASEEARTVDLGALISTVCCDLSDIGMSVACDEVRGVTISCRPVALKRALWNVIENAVAYGDRARVILATSPSHALIHVDDDGPGIPPEDFSKIFDPFVRLEGSRNRSTGGCGLGLSITKSVIESHGGDIVLHNRVGGGLRVTLALPLTKQAILASTPPTIAALPAPETPLGAHI